VPDIPFVVNTGAAEAQTGPNPPHFGEGSGGGSAPAESAHHAPIDQGEIDLGSVHVPAVADTVADQDLGPAEHYAVPDDVAPDAFDIDDN
jgi:hypothetical protein